MKQIIAQVKDSKIRLGNVELEALRLQNVATSTNEYRVFKLPSLSSETLESRLYTSQVLHSLLTFALVCHITNAQP